MAKQIRLKKSVYARRIIFRGKYEKNNNKTIEMLTKIFFKIMNIHDDDKHYYNLKQYINCEYMQPCTIYIMYIFHFIFIYAQTKQHPKQLHHMHINSFFFEFLFKVYKVLPKFVCEKISKKLKALRVVVCNMSIILMTSFTRLMPVNKKKTIFRIQIYTNQPKKVNKSQTE